MGLTQKSMAKLFDTTRNNITMHLKNIFDDAELNENSVSKEILLTANDGKKYNTKFYNLEAIIAVGYRVKSVRGTQFRVWANKIIKDYLVKGYNLNSDRFKNNGGGVYFEELLEKIDKLEIFVHQKKYFGEKFWIFMLQALIMMEMMKLQKNSLKQSKIKCITR